MACTLTAHLKALAKERITASAWFRSAPSDIQAAAVIRLAGAEWTKTVDDVPMQAVYAECLLGEETRRFRALVAVVSEFRLEE